MSIYIPATVYSAIIQTGYINGVLNEAAARSR